MLRTGLLTLLTTLALASSAQASELFVYSGILELHGTDAAEVVHVEPTPSGWTFTANHVIDVLPSGGTHCSNDSSVVSCTRAPAGQEELDWIGIYLFGGTDTIDFHESAPGEPIADTQLLGGSGNDTIKGGSDDDWVFGDDGDDVLDGRSGGDLMDGSWGNDHITGGAGNDHMNGEEHDDTLVGGLGDDSMDGESGVDAFDAGPGDDHIAPGTGNDGVVDGGTHVKGDWISYSDDRKFGVTADLSTTAGDDGDPGEDAIGFEHLNGSQFADKLYGTNGPERIRGGSGPDEIWGRGGDDHIQSEYGDDVLHGEAGDDTLDASWGNDLVTADVGADVIIGGTYEKDLDTIDYSARTEPVEVHSDADHAPGEATDGGASDDVDGAGPLATRDRVSGFEILKGGSGDDALSVHDGYEDFELQGGAGDDALTGGAWEDKLLGGPGRDTLDGGLRVDAVLGESDDDLLRSADKVYGETLDCGEGAGDRIEPDPSEKHVGCESDATKPPPPPAPTATGSGTAGTTGTTGTTGPTGTTGTTTGRTGTAGGTGTTTARPRPPIAKGQVSFGYSRLRKGAVKVSTLTVTSLRPGTTVTLRCFGTPRRKVCPPTKRIVGGATLRIGDLLSRKRRRVPAGVVLSLTVSYPGTASRITQLTTHPTMKPKVEGFCQEPGASYAERCWDA